MNLQDKDGFTALMYSIYYNYDPITEYLIEHGADVNVRDKTGYTALWWANRNGNEKIEKLLKQKGAKD